MLSVGYGVVYDYIFDHFEPYRQLQHQVVARLEAGVGDAPRADVHVLEIGCGTGQARASDHVYRRVQRLLAAAVTAGFVSLPGTSFVTQGAATARNRALVSLGADYSWRSGLTASLALDGEFGLGTAGFTGKAALKLSW